jgi:DNA-binding transcriptional LysR family regulator
MKWDARIGRRLKLHDLHVLLTVAELGSMGKAAERLAVSQPSVSKAIADMEHAIGVRLLDRTAKGVETTAYGRALLQRGLGAFDELRQGIRDIESLADPSVGEVRVGVPEAIASGLLSAAIERLARQHPRVVVSVTAANNMTQEFRLLRDRTVDFLLGAVPHAVADDLQTEILFHDRSYILCGSGHPLARRRNIALEDLVDQQWVWTREGFFSSYLIEAFEAKGLAAPVASVQTFSVHQRISLLVSNRFLSAESGNVLRFNAARFPIKILPVEFKPRAWPVCIVTLKKRTVSPVVQTFMNCVREAARPMAKASL